VPGFTTGREHQLLSDLELKVCLLADFSPRFVDIREQFPLFSRIETQSLAKRLGIKHPRYPRSSVDMVLTTDFLLTTAGPHKTIVARSVKYQSDLADERTLEKLELEKRYWQERGVQWQLITELDIPQDVWRNVYWLRRGVTESFNDDLERQFTYQLEGAKADETLRELFIRIERRLKITPGQASIIFRHLVWKHTIHVDIHAKLDLAATISSIGLKLPVEGESHASAA